MEAFDAIRMTNFQLWVIKTPSVPPNFELPISSKSIRIYTRFGFTLSFDSVKVEVSGLDDPCHTSAYI